MVNTFSEEMVNDKGFYMYVSIYLLLLEVPRTDRVGPQFGRDLHVFLTSCIASSHI